MEKLIVFFLSLFPVILIGKFIYENDKHKEPKGLLLKLFVAGILSFFFVYIINLLLKQEFIIFNKQINEMNIWQLILYSFIFVALVQQITKWLMIYFISFKHKEFDEMYDIVVYSVFTNLGFICISNLYILFNESTYNLFNIIVDVPIGACIGIVTGYYLGMAKSNLLERKKSLYNIYFILSIIIPTLIQGLFSFLLLLNRPIIVIIVLLLCYPVYVFATKKLKRIGRKSFRLLFNKK